MSDRSLPTATSGGAHPDQPAPLHAAVPAWFISDLHLCEEEPATAAAFCDFLAVAASEARSLFILGDLFEYWAGDDDVDDPFNQRICAAVRALGAAGTQIYFMSGNRDLLAGAGFAAASGAQLLSDPSVVRLGDGANAPTVLLAHGDALCTDDTAYQAYRQQVRDPAWQAGFLAQPLAERKAFIAALRQHSEASKAVKSMDIMDVNPAAVAYLLHQHGCAVLVHGHTHRPARHTLVVDGRDCVRWVLADWHGEARWLACDGHAFSAHEGSARAI